MFDFKHGQLLEAKQQGSDSEDIHLTEKLQQVIKDRKLFDPDWRWTDIAEALQQSGDEEGVTKQTEWLQTMLPSSHNI
jgi:hypothetical protein